MKLGSGILALVVLFGSGGVAIAQGHQKPGLVSIIKQSHGTVSGDKIALRKLAPKHNLLLDQASWSRLWEAWHGGKAPEIDFQSQFVVVGTVSGATYPDGKTNEVWVGQGGEGLYVVEGNWTIQYSGFDMKTPGFAYVFAIVQRGDVKSIDGKALPPPRNDPAVTYKLLETIERLEKANAAQREAIAELRKQIEELKKN